MNRLDKALPCGINNDLLHCFSSSIFYNLLQKNILSVNVFACSKAWLLLYIQQVATQYVYGRKPQWHPRLRIWVSKTLLDIKEKWALYQICDKL